MLRSFLVALLALPVAAATGPVVPELASFDSEIAEFMESWKVPGASIAISYQGRLVLARAYGLADVQLEKEVQPRSLFRIASVSKPVTAVAILMLYERGLLDLNDHVINLVPDLIPADGPRDPRVAEITVRDLLRHSGGWDAAAQGVDMQFLAHEIAAMYGVAPPPPADLLVTFALDQQLDAAPATRFAYANVGYTILGRIIERVTGRSYEEYVRSEVLAPLRIRCMRIGGTFEWESAPHEVRYYADDLPHAPSITDPDVLVPLPYGAFDMRALDAAGGWIAAAAEVVRLADAIDGFGEDVLKDETVAEMIERPPYWDTPGAYYALGWLVQGGLWFHTGGLPGTASYLLRFPGGLNLFVVFNTLAFDENGDATAFYRGLDVAIDGALSSVTSWPSHDLYPSVLPCQPRRRAVRR